MTLGNWCNRINSILEHMHQAFASYFWFLIILINFFLLALHLCQSEKARERERKRFLRPFTAQQFEPYDMVRCRRTYYKYMNYFFESLSESKLIEARRFQQKLSLSLSFSLLLTKAKKHINTSIFSILLIFRDYPVIIFSRFS